MFVHRNLDVCLLAVNGLYHVTGGKKNGSMRQHVKRKSKKFDSSSWPKCSRRSTRLSSALFEP